MNRGINDGGDLPPELLKVFSILLFSYAESKNAEIFNSYLKHL